VCNPRVSLLIAKEDENGNLLLLLRKEGDSYLLPSVCSDLGEYTEAAAKRMLSEITKDNNDDLSLLEIVEHFEDDCYIGFYYYVSVADNAVVPQNYVWKEEQEVISLLQDGVYHTVELDSRLDSKQRLCYDIERYGGDKVSTG